MKRTMICLLSLGLLASIAFGNDSLRCRMIDWLDAPTNHNFLHEPVNDTWPFEYSYSGTKNWDLAMGDSFMVWLPGSDRILFLDAYETSEVDTIANFDYGSVNAQGVTVYDSIIYLVGGGGINTLRFRNDSLILKGFGYTPWASYHFAALEDSFLYTINLGYMDTTGLTCINVANPESIFIYRGVADGGSKLGLEVIDGYAYSGYSGSLRDSPYGRAWPVFYIYKTDVTNSDTPGPVSGGYYSENRCLGSICSDGEFIYFVNSEMSDGPAWTIGGSDLFVLGTDTSYSFDSRWHGQGVFGVEALNENIMAAGFEHGISVLNIQNLDSIYEVAYYMDLDSTMDITHLAMKESRIYAMGHPRNGFVRLYMFDVGDSVVSAIGETMPIKPSAIEISAYPNPFNSAVTIAIEGGRGLINQTPTVEIFDLNGRKIDVIARRAEPNEAISPNNRSSVPLDTRRDAVSINNCEFVWQPDESLPSGVYLVRARGDSRSLSGAEATIATKRIVYLK